MLILLIGGVNLYLSAHIRSARQIIYPERLGSVHMHLQTNAEIQSENGPGNHQSVSSITDQETPIPEPLPVSKWRYALDVITTDKPINVAQVNSEGILLDVHLISMRGAWATVFFSTRSATENVVAIPDPIMLQGVNTNTAYNAFQTKELLQFQGLTLFAATFDLTNNKEQQLNLSASTMQLRTDKNVTQLEGKWPIPLLIDQTPGVVDNNLRQMFTAKPFGTAIFADGMQLQVGDNLGTTSATFGSPTTNSETAAFFTFSVTSKEAYTSIYLFQRQDNQIEVASTDNYRAALQEITTPPTPFPTSSSAPDLVVTDTPPLLTPVTSITETQSLQDVFKELEEDYEKEVERLKGGN